jgi:hypothetical protein
VLAFAAALAAMSLQPLPAATAGTASRTWNTDAPVADAVDGINRLAVKPPERLQASTKKRLGTEPGPSPWPVTAAAESIEPAYCECRAGSDSDESIDLKKPAAIVAQPRAPPFIRAQTPAV